MTRVYVVIMFVKFTAPSSAEAHGYCSLHRGLSGSVKAAVDLVLDMSLYSVAPVRQLWCFRCRTETSELRFGFFA